MRTATQTDRMSTTKCSSAHRRMHRRHGVDIEIGFHSDSNFYMGFTENLSEGGLFIATYDYAPLGSWVEFTFRLPGMDRNIQARGVVRWVREYNEMTTDVSPGMGIQFQSLPPAVEHAIRRFIRSRDPLFYDV